MWSFETQASLLRPARASPAATRSSSRAAASRGQTRRGRVAEKRGAGPQRTFVSGLGFAFGMAMSILRASGSLRAQAKEAKNSGR